MSRVGLAAIFTLTFLLSNSIFAFNDSRLPQIQIGQPGEKRGEIISPSTRLQIAAWCDFTKQIVVFNGQFLCVYNGNVF